uniref:Glutaredoxin-3 n=1 Tax=Caligus rogercresseyi TaxID=217165 RepID=C1BND4_CALRO|nr:Glutaredoxin-3 [Caligus rogercresseyi]|eukprot:TRINITY_DN3700_c0_g1_i2.p1 TRINITY_DN3700_c0_g1~~TRINITY_DN3700_c0_g1_i2.p1  ORF type:complete len:327 (-),score=112.95 TRINITY_DN3700_c0_g1_i2:237-1217(-)
MSVTDIKTPEEFRKIISEDRVILVHFWVPWAKECPLMNEAMEELAREEPTAALYRLDAEEVTEIPTEYEVHAVPTFLFFRKGQKIERIDGAHPVKVVNALKTFIKTPSLSVLTPSGGELVVNVHKRCEKLLSSAPVMLFMKGGKEEPKCKFSRATIDILSTYEDLKYSTFDILQDEAIRQGLKDYSKWPTYPQLYVQGNLIGGLDIIKEMHESGELSSVFPKKEKDLNERLKELTNKSSLMIFMKGSPQEPRCGFSRQLMNILSEEKLEFGTFDILGDEEVRQGLKTYSNWPTYPQVYVKGELVGGLDIIKELKENDELRSTLKPE